MSSVEESTINYSKEIANEEKEKGGEKSGYFCEFCRVPGHSELDCQKYITQFMKEINDN